MHTTEKKVALVTGASSGIGRGIAQYLLTHHYRVILVARNPQSLQTTCDQVAQNGHEIDAIPIALDVTDYQGLTQVLMPIIDKIGRLDLLVNSAGNYKRGTAELARTELIEMLAVNLIATIDLIQLTVPLMRQQGFGHIINIASQSGVSARRYSGGYAASKFGVVGFTEALHKELAPNGIGVTAICPGYVDTPLADDVTSVTTEAMISVEDIVKTVAYLLSLSPNAIVNKVIMNSHGQLLNWIDC